MNTYQKIAKRIVDDILRGCQNTAEQLPSERALAEKFRCSRVTIRSALEVLEQQGVITRTSGKGRIVVNDALPDKGEEQRENSHISQISVVIFGGRHLMHMYSRLVSVIRDILPTENWMVNYWHLDHKDIDSQRNYPAALEKSSAYFVTGDYSNADLVWFCNQQKPLMVLGQAGDDVLRNIGHSHIRVFYDMKNAYEWAVDLLWSRGYRRPAILLNSMHQADLDRYEGFCRALTKHDCDPADYLCITANQEKIPPHDRTSTYRAVDEMLEQKDKFDSVVTNSYDILLCEMYRRKMFLEDNFALIAQTSGHDTFVEELGITEIRVDNMLATKSAMNVFMDMGKTDSPQGWYGREVILTPEFVVRESCPKIESAATESLINS